MGGSDLNEKVGQFYLTINTKWKGGQLLMDYRTIVEKHPDRYVIAAVAERGENNFVSSWEVLSADSKSFNEAKEKLKFFESEGVKGCCIINTYADASDETEAGAVARMFRLMYGMDMV